MLPACLEEKKGYILKKLENRVAEPYCKYLALYLAVLIDFLLDAIDFVKVLLLIFATVAACLGALYAPEHDYLYFVAGILGVFTVVDIVRSQINFYKEWKDWQRKKISMKNIEA